MPGGRLRVKLRTHSTPTDDGTMGLRATLSKRLSSNRRGALSIFTGIAAGQLLALAAAPLLSRLYSPTDFGVFATCSAIVLTIGTVAGLRFELAVPLPRRDQDAYGLVMLGIISATVVGVLSTLAVLLGGAALAGALGQPQLMPWLWVVPPGVTATGYYLALNQLAIRRRRFAAIGRRSIAQSLTILATQIGAGLAHLRPGGLVLGLGVGQAVSAASMLPGSGIRSAEARSGRTRPVLRSLLVRYRRFPLILGPAGLLNVLGLQLPVLLLAAWYGGEVAGWMGLTQRVLAFPVALVGTAVAQVYLSEIARTTRDDLAAASRLFRRATLGLSGLAVVLLLGLLLLGPAVFSIVFGSEWTTSGRYAQALAVGLAAQLVASPLSQTLIVLERQRLQFISDLLRVLAMIAVVFVAHVTGASALTAVWAVGVTLAVTYTLSWTFCRQSLIAAARSERSHR